MERVIEIALNEVGYLEKDGPEHLDEKTAFAGKGNYTKYARDLDQIPVFYNGSKQGNPWCDIFVDWCFVKAYGWRRAEKMLCQHILGRGAGCRYSMAYFRDAGRLYADPEPGDQIFFQSEGKVCHTGLVVAVDRERVYTVEGNTSSQEGVVANGGCVRRKSYPLSSDSIAGYGRPRYERRVAADNLHEAGL